MSDTQYKILPEQYPRACCLVVAKVSRLYETCPTKLIGPSYYTKIAMRQAIVYLVLIKMGVPKGVVEGLLMVRLNTTIKEIVEQADQIFDTKTVEEEAQSTLALLETESRLTLS